MAAGLLATGLVGGAGTSWAVTTSFLAPSSASAATHGAGFDVGKGFLGAYRHPDGTLAYCLQIMASIPYSPTSGPSLNSDWNSLSPDQLARLSYIVDVHGTTEDANTAAAVALYVWDLADNAAYNSHGMPGDVYYSARAGANRDAVLGLLRQYRAEAAGVTAVTPGRTSGSASLTLDVDASTGTGTVAFQTDPAGQAGAVHLTNAVFDGSGSGDSTMTSGESRRFRVVPGGGSDVAVEARSDEIRVAGASGYVGNITTWAPGRTAEQWSASKGQKIDGSFTIAAATAASAPIPMLFSPIASTQVSTQRVEAGKQAIDTVRAGVAPGSAEWRTLDGAPVPVVYRGTLHGPFTEQPTPSDSAPAGAPVVGGVELTATGPGSYTSPGVTVPSAGFYTWVWRVEEAWQAERAKPFLPDGYTWSDRFGLVAETHLSPTTVAAETRVADEEIPVTATSTDTLTVKDTGAWLRKDGRNVPVTFTGTAYWVPGTGEVPATKPESATVLTTSSIVVEGPGTFTSEPATAPAGSAGHIVWVWSAPETLFTRGWADGWATRGEVVRVTTPEVRTRATPSVPLSATARDEAVVDGEVPEGAVITFEAYRQIGDRASCTPESRVHEGSTSPVPVAAGKHEKTSHWSGEVRFTEPGTYHWVETLLTRDGRVLHRGECGAPGETTKVTVPGVTSRAEADVAVNDAATDDAIVTGDVPPGASLVWKAYRAAPGPVASAPAAPPVCDATTLAADTTGAPVAVEGAGTYTSPPIVLTAAGAVHWVEELHAFDGSILAQGECGAPGETTTVHAPDVHTRATAAVQAGDPVRDEAVVNGWVPAGAVITFEAFRASGDQAACTAENRVYDGSGSPVATTPGPNENASSWSAETRFTEPGSYYWVETLAAADGTVLHRGECGAPGETTVVAPVPVPRVATALAETGAGPGPWIGGALAALALGLGIDVSDRRRRGRANAVVPDASRG
ncbi:hypothetical protein HQQ82_11730 [Rathayibacter sp. VKM Ac-2856]|uniref:hypothetical protein n=1 Tax=unclassified Rathayibacter TaxID=2609250 RepID=UPI0015655083|nr:MULTISPECIES: hypothetical protein [unclassified Rathayibacter]NQX05482.1 hypothetical protein [Rathayibacter sp. VKM Ac-2858]NQX20643.1 hypothetical protein [Rathayibacter sp. VKM Ac-2856]